MNRDLDDDRWNNAVREHAASTTQPRLDSAFLALRGPPAPPRSRGPAASPASQLRHGQGSREHADAMRRLAGADARRRQQSLDSRLNDEFGGDQR